LPIEALGFIHISCIQFLVHERVCHKTSSAIMTGGVCAIDRAFGKSLMTACKPRRPGSGLHIRMQTQLLSKAPSTQGIPERTTANAGWAGELQDFDSLVKRHRSRIFRFLLASLRNREAAENLTQDCFVRAYRAREQFRGAANIVTWLMQ